MSWIFYLMDFGLRSLSILRNVWTLSICLFIWLLSKWLFTSSSSSSSSENTTRSELSLFGVLADSLPVSWDTVLSSFRVSWQPSDLEAWGTQVLLFKVLEEARGSARDSCVEFSSSWSEDSAEWSLKLSFCVTGESTAKLAVSSLNVFVLFFNEDLSC